MKMFYKDYYVYILASRTHGTLYVGVKSSLVTRVFQHTNNSLVRIPTILPKQLDWRLMQVLQSRCRMSPG